MKEHYTEHYKAKEAIEHSSNRQCQLLGPFVHYYNNEM